MKITIAFRGDKEVGIFPYSFEADVPDPQDDEDREEIRIIVKKMYEDLTGDKAQYVIFEDEEFND